MNTNNLSQLDKSTVLFYCCVFIGYLIYTASGLVIISNNYSRLNCTNMWIYSTVSLLIPFATFLIQLCVFPFLFTNLKNISYFSAIMALFGGLSIYDCSTINNLWFFSIVTFIFQIIVSIFPIIMKIYLFFRGLKTPCCCCDDSIIEEDNNL